MEQSLAPDIDLLLEQLKSSDPGDRRMAAAKLGRLDCRDESVRLALEAVAINDQDSFAQAEAQYVLEELGFPIPKIDRIDRQLERLSSPDKNTRYDACEELRVTPSLRPEATAALELVSNDPDSGVADAARRALLAHSGVEGKKFGIRAGAYIIDVIIFNIAYFGLMFVFSFVVAVAFAISGREFLVDQRSTQCQDIVIGLIIFVLDFTIFEWLYGATPGKIILGMRVVKENGEPCDFKAALIRALLRIIDGLFFGIPAYASMKHPLYQRIGDKSAKTIVVGKRELIIQRPREWWWLLVAVILDLAFRTIVAIFQIVSMVR